MQVAIAEDNVLLRDGIARLLSDAGMDVVARCGTADDLLKQVRSFPRTS
jgi:DNA-binding NarL/FixJ family response regulator